MRTAELVEPHLARTLRERIPSALRKGHLLTLCRIWGYRSDLWAERGSRGKKSSSGAARQPPNLPRFALPPPQHLALFQPQSCPKVFSETDDDAAAAAATCASLAPAAAAFAASSPWAVASAAAASAGRGPLLLQRPAALSAAAPHNGSLEEITAYFTHTLRPLAIQESLVYL